jgi:hypothetical protein
MDNPNHITTTQKAGTYRKWQELLAQLRHCRVDRSHGQPRTSPKQTPDGCKPPDASQPKKGYHEVLRIVQTIGQVLEQIILRGVATTRAKQQIEYKGSPAKLPQTNPTWNSNRESQAVSSEKNSLACYCWIISAAKLRYLI